MTLSPGTETPLPGDPAAIVAAVRVAIEVLVAANRTETTHVATALDALLRGQDIEATLGWRPGWRAELERAARHGALSALLAQQPELDARAVIRGMVRARRMRTRPGGLDGVLWDLSRVGAQLSEGHLRRLLAQVREHCNRSNVRAPRAPSLPEV